MDDERDDASPEPDLAPPGPIEERETRGVMVIVRLTVLGAAAGAVLGTLALLAGFRGAMGAEAALVVGAIDGGLMGTVFGAIAGALVWAFFPYKGPAAAPEQAEPGEASLPQEDQHGHEEH